MKNYDPLLPPPPKWVKVSFSKFLIKFFVLNFQPVPLVSMRLMRISLKFRVILKDNIQKYLCWGQLWPSRVKKANRQKLSRKGLKAYYEVNKFLSSTLFCKQRPRLPKKYVPVPAFWGRIWPLSCKTITLGQLCKKKLKADLRWINSWAVSQRCTVSYGPRLPSGYNFLPILFGDNIYKLFVHVV
jgi:hypothetical protein